MVWLFWRSVFGISELSLVAAADFVFLAADGKGDSFRISRVVSGCNAVGFVVRCPGVLGTLLAFSSDLMGSSRVRRLRAERLAPK